MSYYVIGPEQGIKPNKLRKDYLPIQSHKIPTIVKTLIHTLASADFNQAYDILVVEQLQDLDLSQRCDGKLRKCSHKKAAVKYEPVRNTGNACLE